VTVIAPGEVWGNKTWCVLVLREGIYADERIVLVLDDAQSEWVIGSERMLATGYILTTCAKWV
jgi:hypothetical protein